MTPTAAPPAMTRSAARPERRRSAPRPIAAATFDRAAAVLRVLAHPVRLRIVDRLLRGPMHVGRLAEQLDLPQAVVSQHLAQMRAHGIVQSRRADRRAYYDVINPHAQHLLECIRKHGDGR